MVELVVAREGIRRRVFVGQTKASPLGIWSFRDVTPSLLDHSSPEINGTGDVERCVLLSRGTTVVHELK